VNGNQLTLPEFFDHVYTLGQVIDVDYYLPGCPPPPDLIATAFKAVLSGDLPPKGSTIGPRRALCDTGLRTCANPLESKSRKYEFTRWRLADARFLEQGIICMGLPLAADAASCININTPCRGVSPHPGLQTQAYSRPTSMLKAETDEDARRRSIPSTTPRDTSIV
jgi:F420-non-reducing hydrogenase small subunit